MENSSFSKETEVQKLQNRVIELERQLAEAQDTILALTLPEGDGAQTNKGQEHERLLQELEVEQSLRESEERFSKAFQASPDALVISRMNDGRIIEINESFERLFGYSGEEVIGKSSLDLNMFADSSDRQKAIERLREQGYLRNLEIYVRTRSGEECPVNLSIEKINLHEEDHLLTIIHDVTKRKRAEEERERLLAEVQQEKEVALRRAEELKAVIDALHHPVMVYDQEGVIVRANASSVQLYGFHPSRRHHRENNQTLMVRYPDGSIVDPEEMPVARSLKGEKVIAERLEITNQQGQARTILATATPLVENGVQMGSVVVWHDFTEQHNAEQALRASEARYRRLIEHANEGIWTIDADHRTDFINPRGAQILGYTVEEMLGKPALDFVFPEDSAYSSQQLAERKQGIGAVHDMRMRHKDGHAVWVSSSSTPIYGENGEYLGALAMFIDITERRQAEQALHESEQKYRTFFGHLYETVSILEAVRTEQGEITDWVYLDVNQAALHMLGIPFDQIVGKPVSQMLGAEVLTRYMAEYRRVLETGKPSYHETAYQDKHFLVSVSRMDENRVASIGLDITERKQSEIELQVAHRRNIEILESISDAFYSLDLEGRFTYVNRKAVSQLGKQPGELLGKNIWEVFPSGKETESYLKIQQALADRQPSQYESYSTFLDQWIEVHLYPSEQGISVYFQDISTRKQTEAALAELSGKLECSNRELEQFAFVASHDLQEPLRKIEAFGDSLLESTPQLDDRGRKYLDRMMNAAGRMRDMVEGLLQLSRVSTQGQPFTPVDLSQVAAEVLSDLEHQVRRTGGKVEIDELPVVEGDPLQLHQLLQNLIGNALKYHHSATPPVVKVNARQLSGRVQIRVDDNGIGFNPEEVEQMFQPFQRLVGRNDYEGSGMGLAICRKIVERHSGEITAKGKPGEGSSFIVILPIHEGSSG